MRLDEITIGEFKNLRNFFVDFDEESPYTVLVGENGSGKSNLIEALTLIFRNLDLDVEAPFDYHLKYNCREQDIRIVAEKQQFPKFSVRQKGKLEYKDLTRKRFMDEDEEGRPFHRPAFVFGYYSGPSDRLASLYDRHRERYYSWIIKSSGERRRDVADPNMLRRLFYAETLHGQFALIAFFMATESSDDHAFLREHLQIDGLDSVLFVLKRPPWRRKGGDTRFWNAVGEVQEFLSRLYETAMLPVRMDRRIPTELTKNPSVENLYLFLSGPKVLRQIYSEFYSNQYAFFTALESTHYSKLLDEVRTRVRMTPGAGGGEVTYRELSEGEQQLLLVLGLLKFTAQDEALFLLDEPDTHLNPAWSTQYLDFLDRFIEGRESCHIVMTTHDPLVFSRLKRPQVRIFRRDQNGKVSAEQPLNDPQGMGIQAILASDLFRLRSGGLDSDTQNDLDTQRRLSLKEDRTPDDEIKLREVTDRLNKLGFWKSARDPIYQIFLQKFLPRWIEREQLEWMDEVDLTLDQVREREKLADEIAVEVAAELAAENGDAS